MKKETSQKIRLLKFGMYTERTPYVETLNSVKYKKLSNTLEKNEGRSAGV